MVTYWCCKKNSVVDWISKGTDFDPALVPCRKAECDEWRDGCCIHMSTAERLSDTLMVICTKAASCQWVIF